MPAGVSWPQYIKFFAAAMVSMVAGAQTVHLYYRPLDDIKVLVDRQIEQMKQKEVGAPKVTLVKENADV